MMKQNQLYSVVSLWYG